MSIRISRISTPAAHPAGDSEPANLPASAIAATADGPTPAEVLSLARRLTAKYKAQSRDAPGRPPAGGPVWQALDVMANVYRATTDDRLRASVLADADQLVQGARDVGFLPKTHTRFVDFARAVNPQRPPSVAVEHPAPTPATNPTPANDQQLISLLKAAGIVKPEQLIENSRNWVKTKGENPVAALTALMKQKQIVVVGERHDRNSHTIAGASYIEALAKGGATHFAIEADTSYQKGIDRYMATGDTSGLPRGHLSGPEFLKMYEMARRYNLKVVAVDYNPPVEDDSNHFTKLRFKIDRDYIMASNIGGITSKNPEAKVIFWVGDLHNAVTYYNGKEHTLSKSAGRLLRDHYGDGVARVSYALASARNVINDNVVSQIAKVKTPTLIPIKDSPLSNVPYDDLGIRFGKSYDYVIAYP